ncbi:MAG: hypothetical protein RI957_1892 [Verrucomicrobiota bacterium]|jgi:LysM repeat protein
MKIRILFFAVVIPCMASIAGAATHVIKSGETLHRIAKNYGVTVTQLEQANPNVSANSLRIGAKLVVPSPKDSLSPAPSPAAETIPSSDTTPVAVASEGVYEVKKGDNLSKIAREIGTTALALQKANPNLNPNKMQIGQKIQIPGAAPRPAADNAQIADTAAPAPAPVKQTALEERSPDPVPQPAPAAQEKTSVAEIQNAAQESAPASTPKETPAPASNETSTLTVNNTPVEAASQPAAATYRLIKTTRELTLAEVAKENNTTTDKINALNGWSFSPQTLLAVDSELYIPAQP